MSATKGRPLTKEEVVLLVNLIKSNPIVTSKITNASYNQLKDAAWTKITKRFNAQIESTPRKKSQLRLKWENLKKSARKRNAAIRMNNLQTGGVKPDDDTLDKIASILHLTCDVPFSGDSKCMDNTEIVEEEISYTGCGYGESSSDEVYAKKEITSSGGGSDGGGFGGNNGDGGILTPKPASVTTPQQKCLGKLKRQKQLERESQSREKRNIAIADYYKTKKQCLDQNLIASQEKIKLEVDLLQVQKRKLELDVIELENKIKNKQSDCCGCTRRIVCCVRRRR